MRKSIGELVILANDIIKNYGNQLVLDNLHFRASSGDLVGIKGKSGSGKSTLINLIGLIDTSFEGEMIINSIDVKSISHDEQCELRSNEIGFIFQMYNLLDEMSVKQNILMPKLYNKNKLDISYYHDMISKLGLVSLEKKKVKNLSGGEKQRVAIARALINNPSIIIADEPTGNLDKVNRNRVISILKDLKKQGRIVIIVSHDDYVIDSCEKRYMLLGGKLCKIS